MNLTRLFIIDGFRKLRASFEAAKPDDMDRADIRDVADLSARARILRYKNQRLEQLKEDYSAQPISDCSELLPED
jgi:hypothetical protein